VNEKQINKAITDLYVDIFYPYNMDYRQYRSALGEFEGLLLEYYVLTGKLHRLNDMMIKLYQNLWEIAHGEYDTI